MAYRYSYERYKPRIMQNVDTYLKLYISDFFNSQSV